MEEYIEIPNLPGYVSVKEAAKMLGIADKTVYEYVTEGRIPAFRAARVIMISVEEVQKFRPNISGRPRKSIPIWRISPDENSLIATNITIRVKAGNREIFLQRLDDIRQNRGHLFPGTTTRYILENDKVPGEIQILLVWREAILPNEDEQKHLLEDFKLDLRDVLDWESAHIETCRVLMHT